MNLGWKIFVTIIIIGVIIYLAFRIAAEQRRHHRADQLHTQQPRSPLLPPNDTDDDTDDGT